VAAVSGLVALLNPRVPPPYLLVLYVLVVVAIAMGWGTGLAAVSAGLSIVVFDYLFMPPLHSLGLDNPREVNTLVVFLVTKRRHITSTVIAARSFPLLPPIGQALRAGNGCLFPRAGRL
jgi:K+-sensing histidine kinase KdpD